MIFRWPCCALYLSSAAALLLGAAAGSAARAQTTASDDMELAEINAIAAEVDAGPPGIVPLTRGVNLSLGATQQHDAASGWWWLLSPNVAYRVNRYFSIDAGVPIYMYLDVYRNVGTKAKPLYRYVQQKGAFGDTALTFEGDANTFTLDYIGTLTLGMPSGNASYGVSAGQMTFNLNNHLERSFGRFTPDLELGYGDTSNLVNRRILKSYIAVGPMAHFQGGTSVSLPRNLRFEANAYEELPVAKNIVYSTTGRGKKKVTVATNHDPSEDNGFLTALDIPLSPHVTLSGFYDRSLCDRDDVAGFSFTFLVRASPREESLPR